MNIAVSSQGGSINSMVEERFGRSEYFVIVDSETMRFSLVKNPNVTAMGGAGPQTADLISKAGADIVLTGGVGPNAKKALDELGMKVFQGFNSDLTVKEAVQKHLNTK